MKSKRIGVSILTLFLGLICSLGFVSIPKQKVEASAAEVITHTQYMWDGTAPTLTSLDKPAGKMLDKNNQPITSEKDLYYVLTKENIQLKAEANIGFELKGWYIAYTEDGLEDTVVEGTNNGYVAITTTDQEICNENIIINKFLQENKSANLTIKEMQDSLIIAPVFDYQYYTVTYNGVQTGETIGQFKFGDEITISKDIASNVNIDAISLVSDKVSLSKDADGTIAYGEYKFTQDVNKRTTKVEAKFILSVYQNIEITLRYDRLHRVDFELFLEGDELTTGTEYGEIKSCVNIAEEKAFSKISGTDLSYFVKNGADFNVECVSNYKNGGGYVYYEFATLDGSTGRNISLNGISADRSTEKGNAIQIKYTHKKYNLTFVAVEYNSADKTVNVNSDLIVPDAIQLTRISESVALNETILSTNVGYNHLGFVKQDATKTQYDLLTDKIENYALSNTEPKDTTIYVLYQRKEYSFNLTGLKGVSLTNTNVTPNVTYYPIKSVNGVEVDYGTVTAEGKWIVKGVDGNALNYKIGDTITIELKLNNGFVVSAIAGMTKHADVQIYTLTLDKNFLTDKATTIDLPVSAEKIKYTLTYKIKEDADLKTMAEISVDVPNVDNAWENANILKEDKINDFDNFEDDGYYHIKVTNLIYYQNIILKSKANGTGNAGEYFVFRYFTYDFNTSISGVIGDELTPETQTLPIVINGDTTVYVVYTQPKTQMRIDLVTVPEGSGISFEVYQSSTVKTADGMGLYTLEQNSEVSIKINGLLNNEKLFGYNFKNVELYTFDGKDLTLVDGQTSEDDQNYSFTPNASDLYVVQINLEKIVYEFSLNGNLAGFKYPDEGEPQKLLLQLTVDNPVLQFDKLAGYYVKDVHIKKGEGWDNLSSIAQSNSSRNDENLFKTYSYNLADRFKELVTEYGVREGNIIKIELLITFAKYGYDVEVKYVKFNADELHTSNVDMVYPTIKLGYKFTNDASEEVIYANHESLGNGIKFVGVPYGANITLEVVKGVSVGFTMKGWYDYVGTSQIGETGNLITYSKTANTTDFKLSYRVDFEQYAIKLIKSIDNAGSPKVNGGETATVKFGDSFKIEPNTSLAKGYLFNHYVYKANKLVEYIYAVDSFADVWDELYIKDSNGYLFKNISSIYNEDYDYFTIQSEEVEVLSNVPNSDNLQIQNFIVADYFVEGNEIKFELVYIPLEMTLENISFAAVKTVNNVVQYYPGTEKEIVFDFDSFGLKASDLASYQVFVNGGKDPVNADYKITIFDEITIVIQINKEANGKKVYDLTKGLVLNVNSLKNYFNELNVLEKDDNNGKYEISFKVKDLKDLNTFAGSEDKIITLHYGYLLKEAKQITVTTNMAGSDNFVNNTLLNIAGIKESSSEKSGEVSRDSLIYQDNPFLQDVTVSLDLDNSKDNFGIHSVTIYKNTYSEEIMPNQFAENWIVDNGSFVNLTVLDFDVIIQFNVQPRIYVEGEEITKQPEKWIPRTYQFKVENNTIQGLPQEIELSKNDNGKNIAGYGMEYLAIEFWQKGVQVEPINVGEYEIKFVFNDKASETDKKNCWLSYMELPCAIKLRISSVVISVTYEKPTTFEQEYHVPCVYNLGLKKAGTKLVSDDGNIVVSGKYGNDIPFDMGLLNTIGGKAEIVSGNKLEGIKAQKNVTGNYIHIFITGLAIKDNDNDPDNNNFVLRFEEYDYFTSLTDTEKRSGVLVENIVKIVPKVIYIENLEVFDKVYNGDAIAQFDVAKGSSGYRIMHIYSGVDEVDLLPSELKIYFTNAPITAYGNLTDLLDDGVGGDKYVVIDARTALAGRDKANYVIGDLGNGLLNYKDLKTIYPYQITASIKGVGNVTLTNERGKTDHTKANLIPVGSKVALIADRIEPNSVGYREIEQNISSYLTRRNTFACGYKLTLLDNNGMEVKISNELSLTLPNEESLKNIVSIVGDRAKNIQYTLDSAGNIVIDLSQIEEDISTFCLIQNRALLKAWQIVLIVVLSVVVAAGIGVAVFFIVRRRRKKNEKNDVI